MLDPESGSPVFVDPSGRRRRVLRAIVIAGGIVTVGYLSVVLLAVLGAPLPPAARLPAPPRVDSGSTAGASSTAETTAGLTEPEPISTGADATRATRTSTGPAPRPTTAPSPTTTDDRGRPSTPPGQGKPPTTPPGHG